MTRVGPERGAATDSTEWSDGRLDAAFQAGFDRGAPAYLRERILEDVGEGTGVASGRWSGSRLLQSAAAPVAILAVVVFTIAIAGLGPSTRPLSPTASASTTPGLPPVDAIGRPFPSTVRPAGFQQLFGVLTVRGAVTIRDRGGDQREIAVGGWYVPRRPVPCPLLSNEYQPLESCSLDSSWLLDSPLQLQADPQLAGSTGPAIHPVSDWVAPSGARTPIAVVFVGHFDDPGAGQCPAGERRQRCLDRFVVDAVAWDDGASLVAFPTEIQGLQVVTVSQAIFDLEMNLATELAVAGWYQAPSPVSCPAGPEVIVPFLEGGCDISQTWFMQDRESIITLTNGGQTTTFDARTPNGPAFNPVFPIVAPPPVELPRSGASTPAPAILVGHFIDRRASFCQVDDPQACVVRFVVDAVPWVDGIERPLPQRSDSRGPSAPAPAFAPAERVREVAAIGVVLNIAALVGDDLARIEPGFNAPALDLPTGSSYWIVTAISDAGPGPEARSFVITVAGAVFGVSVTGFELIAPPGPAPAP
jgi:hypothetical protein